MDDKTFFTDTNKSSIDVFLQKDRDVSNTEDLLKMQNLENCILQQGTL